MIKFTIHPELQPIKPELEFVIHTWAKNAGQDVEWVTVDGVTIGIGSESRLRVGEHLQHGNFNHVNLSKDGMIEIEPGKPDYLSTVFYLINSLQEYHDSDPDELGRFKFKNSYQSRLKNTDTNVVQHCFDGISKLVGVHARREKTSFFLTHDIDMVYGSIVEDGFNVIKKGRFDQFLKLLFSAAIGRPDWLNMDKIMKLESDYDCKSVFYWIVNKGTINAREKNADYVFQSKKIQKHFKDVEQNGFENGIHKSISSETFQEEFVKFGSKPIANRYHYLKFSLPKAYCDLEDAGLLLDASLGFAEQPGLRNNYGLPFNPYDLEKRKSHSFVEVPLHVMDRTFFQYKKASVHEAENEIFSFFEKNRENCVLSILWHNNFFTDYKFKGYPELYKKILAYIRDNNFSSISQQEIIQQFSITK